MSGGAAEMPWMGSQNFQEFMKDVILTKADDALVNHIVDKVCTLLRESPQGKKMKVHNCFRAGSSAKKVALQGSDVDLVLYLKDFSLSQEVVDAYLRVRQSSLICCLREPCSLLSVS